MHHHHDVAEHENITSTITTKCRGRGLTSWRHGEARWVRSRSPRHLTALDDTGKYGTCAALEGHRGQQ